MADEVAGYGGDGLAGEAPQTGPGGPVGEGLEQGDGRGQPGGHRRMTDVGGVFGEGQQGHDDAGLGRQHRRHRGAVGRGGVDLDTGRSGAERGDDGIHPGVGCVAGRDDDETVGRSRHCGRQQRVPGVAVAPRRGERPAPGPLPPVGEGGQDGGEFGLAGACLGGEPGGVGAVDEVPEGTVLTAARPHGRAVGGGPEAAALEGVGGQFDGRFGAGGGGKQGRQSTGRPAVQPAAADSRNARASPACRRTEPSTTASSAPAASQVSPMAPASTGCGLLSTKTRCPAASRARVAASIRTVCRRLQYQ